MPASSVLYRFDAELYCAQQTNEGDLFVFTDKGLFRYDPDGKRSQSVSTPGYVPSRLDGRIVSPCGHYLAYLDETGAFVHLYDLIEGRALRRYRMEAQRALLLGIDPESRYLLVGTDEGRVLLYRLDAASLIARLHSFPEYSTAMLRPRDNFVSAFAFDGERLASSGYGGSVVLTDIASQMQTRWLRPGRNRQECLAFWKGRYLIAGSHGGVLEKIDLDVQHPHQRLSTPLGPIRHLQLMPAQPFAFAASSHRTIALIDLESMELIREHYITTPSPIVALHLAPESRLLATLASGEVLSYALMPTQSLQSLIDAESYARAYALCDEEPLLRRSSSYARLEAIFARRINEARRALISSQHELARHLTQPFAKAKHRSVHALFAAFDHYPRLKHLCKLKNYSAAYGLVKAHPHLKAVPEFVAVEAMWEERFSTAQRLVLMGRSAQAKARLIPFATVPSKGASISLLLHKPKSIVAFSQALTKRDYGALKRLGSAEPVLRGFPSYQKMMREADSLRDALLDAVKADEFERAELLLFEMGHIPHLQADAERMRTFLSLAKNLFNAFEKGHERSAYSLIDRNSELAILDAAQKLERAWLQRLRRCESLSIRGDARGIKETLGSCIDLPRRHERIGDLFRLAYRIQLHKLLANRHVKAAIRGITRYLGLFGMDTELQAFVKHARLSSLLKGLDPELFKRKSRDAWRSEARNMPDLIHA